MNSFLTRYLKTFGSLFLLLGCLSAWALVPVPKLLSHVTDLTATLNSDQIAALESRLMAFEQQKGSQIAILIVPTTQPEAIEQFSIRVTDIWKLGRKKIDDGVLLIVAKNDRKLRIEVGYGLEGAIPDAVAKRITSEIITPFFKAGDFAGGLEAGVNQLIKVIDGEPLPPPASESTTQINDGLFLTILLGGIVGGWILSALFGRSTGSTLAALGSGGIAAFLLGLSIAVFIALMVFFFVGARFSSGGGWSNGGGFGGYGGGGGFGGGNTWGGGGGGGFGGGGASDSW